MKKICIVTLILSINAFAQFTDRGMTTLTADKVNIKGDSYFTKAVQVIDCPTASILRGGDFRAGIRAYEFGGLNARLSVGISNRIMFGVSYGGLDIIGNQQQIQWNPMPGVHFIYRIVDESMKFPAIVAGFDSQGYGYWYTDDEDSPEYNESINGRYDFKSRGFFVTVSKGYSSIIDIGLHAGLSTSLEQSNGKISPTLYMATDMMVARDLAFLLEYDFSVNDPDIHTKGILNTGIRWAFGSNMFFEFSLKNMLGSKDLSPDVRRIIKLTYYGHIID